MSGNLNVYNTHTQTYTHVCLCVCVFLTPSHMAGLMSTTTRKTRGQYRKTRGRFNVDDNEEEEGEEEEEEEEEFIHNLNC